MCFEIIDLKTGKYPDTYEIALREDWAKSLCYCDIDGFYYGEDGTLMLVDECLSAVYCPHDRFQLTFKFPNGEHTFVY